MLAYAMIVMVLMSLGVALTQLKVFSFKNALISSIGRVIVGPIIGFALIKIFNLSGFAAGVLLIQASMPSAGIDAAGNIWLSFSGYTETVDNGTQVFRHIYVTKSEDGGNTWKTPVDVTPHEDWNGMQECVYGSMSPVHFIKPIVDFNIIGIIIV